MMVVPVQVFADILPKELPQKEIDINGVFEISTRIDNQWVNAGNLGFGKFQEIKEINLRKYLKGDDALIKISQNGGGASYLDAVFLDGAKAIKANGSEGKVLNKLSKEDLDVTPVEDGIVLEFTANSGAGILSVAGRIENEVIASQPLQFPAENNFKFKEEIEHFYSYTLNSNIGSIKTDGVLDEVENLEPFIKDYRIPDSGHPAGDLYFWVMNDNEYLYVTMDITPDNTYDGDKDYAKVYINTDEGIKEFKVSVPETKWGNTAFTYTDKVAYEHKVYEFAIPLSEIDSFGGEVELAFAAYGTMAYDDNCFNPALAYDSVNDIYLCVFEHLDEGVSYRRIVGEFVDKNGDPWGHKFVLAFETVSAEGDVDLSNPSVVFNPDAGEFIITWVENNANIDCVCAMGIQYIGKDSYITKGPFKISSNETDCEITTPKISYDSDNNEYLIVWSEYVFNYILHGQFLNADGTLKGSKFKICTTGGEAYPSIFYSESQEAFLVAWVNSNNIEACGVKSLEDNSTRVSSVSNLGVGNKPNVSYNYSNQFLFVTWENNGIFGRYFDLNNKSGTNYLDPVYKMDELTIREPHDGYYVGYPSSYYDGYRNMLTVWDLFKAEGDCYAELCYIDIYAKHEGSPFYTDVDLNNGDNINVSRMPIAISGDDDIQNIIAYVVEGSNNIGYRIIGDTPGEDISYIQC